MECLAKFELVSHSLLSATKPFPVRIAQPVHWLNGLGSWGSILSGGWDSSTLLIPVVVPIQPQNVTGYQEFSPRIKWPEREADHSSGAEDKNAWSYTSILPYCLGVMLNKAREQKAVTGYATCQRSLYGSCKRNASLISLWMLKQYRVTDTEFVGPAALGIFMFFFFLQSLHERRVRKIRTNLFISNPPIDTTVP
jgi:hypothetical protein